MLLDLAVDVARASVTGAVQSAGRITRGRGVAAVTSGGTAVEIAGLRRGQQLAVTAWNVAFAIAVVIWAFGWTGGKVLVGQSYADAKVKVEQQRAARAETKATKRAQGKRTRSRSRRRTRDA